MPGNSRYDVLFEPVKIGPVTTKNRFYQVPHCNGMGRLLPDSMIAMRGMKAEGGWGIVATEQCDFHPTGDVTAYSETRLWGDMDIPYMAGMCNAVHEHGGLAAVELVHNGQGTGNIYSREVPIGPMHRPVSIAEGVVQGFRALGDIAALVVVGIDNAVDPGRADPHVARHRMGRVGVEPKPTGLRREPRRDGRATRAPEQRSATT